MNTNLNGSGIRVAQAEAVNNGGTNDWEVDPANVPQPLSLFTYYNNGTSSSIFTNLLGTDSTHADAVGQAFYGPNPEVDPNGPLQGAATNVAHVDNYEADYFINNIVFTGSPPNINDAIVNQSFTFGSVDVPTQEEYDSYYDNYSMKYQTLFVSAEPDGAPVAPPGTSYDCIAVGAHTVYSPGPTIDNGRCKPEIISPALGPDTSYAAPNVSGAAAVLMQAGLRGDGGTDTNSAANMITVKALILNGAVKPVDWMNHPPEPLDTNYGAGFLNDFNSYEELAGGKHRCNFSTNISINASHPPIATMASIPVLSGWDMSTNTSSSTNDEVKHYFFNITNGVSGADFTLTTTLVWNRHLNKTGINNLALYLYNTANNNLIGSSTSVVDNVQHIFIPQLQQGRYDLEVWKAGGNAIVSTNEPYALAWQIYSDSLHVTQSGTNTLLSWPAFPDGFAVAVTTSLNPPVVWTTNCVAPFYTNGLNVISLPPTNVPQFYRLQEPDL